MSPQRAPFPRWAAARSRENGAATDEQCSEAECLRERLHRAPPAFSKHLSVASHFEAGKTGRYFAGLTAIDLGQTGQAETNLKQVADGHDAPLASLAKLALANLYQQLNRSSEAVVLYNQLIAKPTSTVPADAAKLQLAAVYEKTSPAEANKIYAQLKSSKTAAGQIATQKLQQK